MNKIIIKIENALQTDNGQRFLQYAYSFGAAIVIFGAMVKVLHWWGIWGNIVFGTGMAIECIVFILYGLDRPPKGYENVRPATVGSKDSTDQPVSASDNVMKFAQATETLTKISGSLQESYRYILDNSQSINLNTLGYIQQMEALNRNISGLNTIYEIQLKGISGQIDTLDRINKGLDRIKEMYEGSVPDSSVFRSETEKMTQQIRELNQIYGRLIEAMTSQKS